MNENYCIFHNSNVILFGANDDAINEIKTNVVCSRLSVIEKELKNARSHMIRVLKKK